MLNLTDKTNVSVQVRGFEKFAIIFFFLPLAFDFKGVSEGGNFFQLALVLITLMSGLSILLLKNKEFDRFSIFSMGFAVGFYVLGSTVTAILNDVDFQRVWRTVLPYCLFLLAYFVTHKLSFRTSRIFALKCLIYACIISVLFSFAYGMLAADRSLEDVRYRIISPQTIATFGVMVFLYSQKLIQRKTALILMLFILVMLGLSVTRSLLISIVFIYIYVHLLVIRLNGLEVKSLIMQLLILIAIVIGAELTLYLILPNVFDNWTARIFYSYQDLGYDITTLTRLAEVENQYDQWTETGFTFLFGKGVGASYSYNSSYYYDLLNSGAFTESILQSLDDYQNPHNMWVFNLFSGGLVFGGYLLLIIIKALVRPFFILINKVKIQDAVNKPYKKIILAIGCIGAISFLLHTIGGSPLGTRSGAFFYGAFFAVLATGLKKKFQ